MEGAETQAQQFVSRSLLQGYERRYEVHDVVLDLARKMIQEHHFVLHTASARQLQYLGRLNVLLEITARGKSDAGFYVLDSMWQAVEDLSRDPHLRVHTYRMSLRELERGSDSQQGQHLCFWVVARVFELQVTGDRMKGLLQVPQVMVGGLSAIVDHGATIGASWSTIGIHAI